MAKIGLFYGTDTGNTERVAKKVKELVEAKIGSGEVELLEIYKKKKEDMAQFDLLILGMPTWYDGELQGDWEEYISEMNQVDFTGKKVAFFGLARPPHHRHRRPHPHQGRPPAPGVAPEPRSRGRTGCARSAATTPHGR